MLTFLKVIFLALTCLMVVAAKGLSAAGSTAAPARMRRGTEQLTTCQTHSNSRRMFDPIYFSLC